MAMCPVSHSVFCSGCGRALLTARFWLTAALLSFGAAAHAGSFTVNPVRVELSDAAPTAVLQVENTQSSPVTVQLSPMAWSQPDGKDVLTPSRDIIASPQIFSLKPGATQLVRIGRMRQPDAANELPYRLLLDEIPAPPPPDFKGLQVVLRISLPVILKPAGAAAPQLAASYRHDAAQLRVQLVNRGNAVAHLQGLSVHAAGGAQSKLAAYPSAVYVLPGQRRELSFPLAESLTDTSLVIKATQQGRAVELHAGSADR